MESLFLAPSSLDLCPHPSTFAPPPFRPPFAPPPPPPRRAFTCPPIELLLCAVTDEELADDAEYADILEDMREECGKYGRVAAVHIPRPGAPGTPPPPGLGKVIIEFAGG